ncbi:MAG: hypothetical protein HQL15_04425 [Candidatus Omnitrophica bacterium]|nr:hypothetical protein [Candidatus Omnitrophota bacterium]
MVMARLAIIMLIVCLGAFGDAKTIVFVMVYLKILFGFWLAGGFVNDPRWKETNKKDR